LEDPCIKFRTPVYLDLPFLSRRIFFFNAGHQCRIKIRPEVIINYRIFLATPVSFLKARFCTKRDHAYPDIHPAQEHHHMDAGMRNRFASLWRTYCPGAELPITFEVGEDTQTTEKATTPVSWRCFVCDLARVRKGTSLVFDHTSITCSGGRLYLGYETKRSENFRYFLSSGKRGVVEGERYKKSPQIVDAITARHVSLPAEGKSYTFRRWDTLAGEDKPDVVIFFARPEVLSALFTLANFDQSDPEGVICPFGSGCSSIVHYPRLEQKRDNPRAVLGMFDPSARPCVPVDILTFAVPMKKFEKMITSMDESFLITKTWEKQKAKIARSNAVHSS